jgi:glycosyltransferase involved in cell wall biosynthesis
MRLELVIPTFRRPALLRGALASVARAARPRTLEVSVLVVNNDAAALGLESQWFEGPYPLRTMQERRRGKSAALNAAIAASTADYIGLIDDDEEIAPDWFQVAEAALANHQLDFIGGPSRLLPPQPPPEWLPRRYAAVLGSWDGGPQPLPYGRDFPGILMGGNAVIARSTLLAVGGYCTDLGPRADRRLGSCEDEDMYWRLVDAGARGLYLPDLVVHHHVHPERLRTSYYRSWFFWNGASKGVLGRRRLSQLPAMAGVPRYAVGEALRGVVTWLRGVVPPGRPADRMAGELPIWHLAGRLYGRYLQRAPLTRFPDRPQPNPLDPDPPDEQRYGDDSIIDSRSR